MPWLRIDDGFATHPKIGKLSADEFRVWVRVLCYCARYKDPSVDDATVGEVQGLTPARVAKYAQLGLLDPQGADWEVHDWKNYLPKDQTGAERQALWRARRNASRNGAVTP